MFALKEFWVWVAVKPDGNEFVVCGRSATDDGKAIGPMFTMAAPSRELAMEWLSDVKEIMAKTGCTAQLIRFESRRVIETVSPSVSPEKPDVIAGLSAFLNEEQIVEAMACVSVEEILKRVIEPNLKDIREKLNQDMDPMFLAYLTQHLLDRSKRETEERFKGE